MSLDVKNAVNQIVECLQKGKSAEIEWNCGNDSSILTIYLDRQLVSYKNQDFADLEELIAIKLSLPDVGETYAGGGGIFVLEHNSLFLDYKTTWDEYEATSPSTMVYDDYEDIQEGNKKEPEAASLESRNFIPHERKPFASNYNIISGILEGRCLIADLNQLNPILTVNVII